MAAIANPQTRCQLFWRDQKMTCRTVFLNSSAALLLCSAGFAADTPACPAKIDVRQQLATNAPGWTATQDDSPHQLAGITFYDGPPQQKASLVYDDMAKAGGKQIARWRFTPDSGRQTWIACSYSGTSLELTKSLPPNTSACEVTYDPRQQVAGLPLIDKISCR
jgi:hypothetical protein